MREYFSKKRKERKLEKGEKKNEIDGSIFWWVENESRPLRVDVDHTSHFEL